YRGVWRNPYGSYHRIVTNSHPHQWHSRQRSVCLRRAPGPGAKSLSASGLLDPRRVLQIGWQFERWQKRLANHRLAKLATEPCYTFWSLFHAAPVNIETDLGVEAVAQERRRYFRRCCDKTLRLLDTLQLLQGLRETDRDAYR